MKTKFRIAFISQEYPPETGWGGIGSYTYEMANGLSSLGIEVIVICRAVDKPKIHKSDSLEIHRVLPSPNWEKLPGGWRINRFWPGFAWAAAQRLKELHKVNPVHLVEYPEARADGLFVPILLKEAKRVVRLHTAWIFVDRINKTEPSFRKKWMYWLESQTILHAHCVTTPSHAMLDLTEDWIPSLRKHQRVVLPNPVDHQTFFPMSQLKDLSEIVFIGRPERRKGLETIRNALQEVLQAYPRAVFRFLCSPQSEIDGQPVQNWIQQHLSENLYHRVLFGSVPRNQMPSILAGASLCVMPSIWENFPYAVLEAMSCGLPVIVSSVGGLPEIVENNVTGLLVPPQDPQALIQAAHQLLGDKALRNRMGIAARACVESKYSRAAVLPKMLEIYQQLAS